MSFQLFRHHYFSNSPKLFRFVHRNHPGHKKPRLATPVHLQLPDTYVTEPIYPPVKPKFPPGQWSEETSPKLAWLYYNDGQKFHSLKTIQERLSVMAYLNVQQTIDTWKVRRTKYSPIYQLSAMPKTPEMLEFSQYITKTSLSVNEQKKDEDEVKLNFSVGTDLYEMAKNK